MSILHILIEPNLLVIYTENDRLFKPHTQGGQSINVFLPFVKNNDSFRLSLIWEQIGQ